MELLIRDFVSEQVNRDIEIWELLLVKAAIAKAGPSMQCMQEVPFEWMGELAGQDFSVKAQVKTLDFGNKLGVMLTVQSQLMACGQVRDAEQIEMDHAPTETPGLVRKILTRMLPTMGEQMQKAGVVIDRSTAFSQWHAAYMGLLNQSGSK